MEALDTERWLSAHLYFRDVLYGNPGDAVLLHRALPLQAAWSQRGLATSFFFIRYPENGNHIRLRARAASPDALTVMRQEVEREKPHGIPPLLRIALEDYEPETHRYGGRVGVRIAEELFHASSIAAVAVLRSIEGAPRGRRLGQAMLYIMAALQVFAADRKLAGALMRMYCGTYLSVSPQGFRANLADSYETAIDGQRGALAAVVSQAWTSFEEGEEVTAEITKYRERLVEAKEQLVAALGRGELALEAGTVTQYDAVLWRIVPSYIHMMNNRLGITLSEESYLALIVAGGWAQKGVLEHV